MKIPIFPKIAKNVWRYLRCKKYELRIFLTSDRNYDQKRRCERYRIRPRRRKSQAMQRHHLYLVLNRHFGSNCLLCNSWFLQRKPKNSVQGHLYFRSTLWVSGHWLVKLSLPVLGKSFAGSREQSVHEQMPKIFIKWNSKHSPMFSGTLPRVYKTNPQWWKCCWCNQQYRFSRVLKLGNYG